MFKGVHTALITPFVDGKIDEDSLIGIINNQFKKNASQQPTFEHQWQLKKT